MLLCWSGRLFRAGSVSDGPTAAVADASGSEGRPLVRQPPFGYTDCWSSERRSCAANLAILDDGLPRGWGLYRHHSCAAARALRLAGPARPLLLAPDGGDLCGILVWRSDRGA